MDAAAAVATNEARNILLDCQTLVGLCARESAMFEMHKAFYS